MVTKLKTGTKVGQLGIWDGTQWVAGDPDCNIVKWGGTALTSRDITPDIKQLSDMEDADKLVVMPKAKGKTTIVSGAGVVNGVTTLYTVTAGKTFYLVYGSVFSTTLAAAVSGTGYIQVDTAGNGSFRNLALVSPRSLTGAVTMPSSSLSVTPSVPMPFAAATVFRVNSDAANLFVLATIMGWEE